MLTLSVESPSPRKTTGKLIAHKDMSILLIMCIIMAQESAGGCALPVREYALGSISGGKMHALVTGSSGFVGSHMCAELKARGYTVTGIDLLPGEHTEVLDVVEFFRQDLGSHSYLHHLPYDLAIHCAFHVGGRVAIGGINTNFPKNLMLDSSMFEWAVRTKQKHVLYFSSSSMYSTECQTEGTQHLLTEDTCQPCWDQGFPDVNYGWSKLTGEKLAEDARRNGLKVTVVRPFSGYGEDQSLDYPFPSIVWRASQGDLTVWGPPGQTRDWIHIDDVTKGALAVVESGTTDPVNLCTGVGTEMGELARLINTQSYFQSNLPTGQYDPPSVQYLVDKPTGVHYRVGDPTRMLKYYTPQVTLEEGIHRALSAQ